MKKIVLGFIALLVWSGASIYVWNFHIMPPEAVAYTVEVEKEFNIEKAIAMKNPSLDPYIRTYIASCINKLSRDKGLDPALVTAIMAKESTFNPMASNKNDDGSYDHGLMMINGKYQAERIKKYKLIGSDLYHIPTNIQLGCEFLKEKITENKNIRSAVQAYNSKTGQGYADKVLAIYGQMQWESK